MEVAPLPKKYSQEAKLVLPKTTTTETKEKSSLLPLLIFGGIAVVILIK